MIGDAIDFYHSLLTDQTALDAQAWLNDHLKAQRLYFGARPICTVLRPYFYLPHQWDFMVSRTATLLNAFRKAHAACMADPTLRAQLYLEAYEEELFSLDIGYDVPWTTSRLDSFYDPDSGRLRFVEYNAETPAGMGYADRLSEAFLHMEIFKRFADQYTVRTFTAVQSLRHTLLEAYRQFVGVSSAMPQIGIIDWADVPTLNEHEIIREHFLARGIQAVLADPRSLEYREGKLWAGDFRIDMIYKRVLCSELVERMGLSNPVIAAVRDKAAMMTNAFSAKLLAKKASFALLGDERNAYIFNDEDKAAIEAHIPWTRIVSERKTRFHGKEVDLIDFIANNKDTLVLKPNDEYGGKGVTIGWETTSDDWAATLRNAQNSPYVVQERVDAVYEQFPSVINGKLDLSPRLVDADPYIHQGRAVSGCLTRLSSMALLNVTAGGGSLAPTFIISKKV
jgi:uncharacterized circularly permuted ATP-grasp superfamily protein